MSELRQAASNGNTTAVATLFNDGVDASKAGPESKRTALHWAVFGGHEGTVSYLLKAAQVPVDPLDKDENTPLNLLFDSLNLSPRKKILMIELLLSNGANPNQPNNQQMTPLMNLIKMREEVACDYFHLLKTLNGLVREMKEAIISEASSSNRQAYINPQGKVSFEAAPITHYQYPSWDISSRVGG